MRPAECPSAGSESTQQLLSPTGLPDRRPSRQTACQTDSRPQGWSRGRGGAGAAGKAGRQRQDALRSTSAQGARRQEVQPGLQRGPQGHPGDPAPLSQGHPEDPAPSPRDTQGTLPPSPRATQGALSLPQGHPGALPHPEDSTLGSLPQLLPGSCTQGFRTISIIPVRLSCVPLTSPRMPPEAQGQPPPSRPRSPSTAPEISHVGLAPQ